MENKKLRKYYFLSVKGESQRSTAYSCSICTIYVDGKTFGMLHEKTFVDGKRIFFKLVFVWIKLVFVFEKGQISRIQFTFEDESFVFHYEAEKRKVVDLCRLWYESEVKFKEYSNGRRVFLGKQPKYNEVQKLKEDYDLDW